MMRRSSRRLRSSIVRALPTPLRRRLIRHQASFSSAYLEGVTVEVARSTADYLAAFRLVHDSYVARGWIEPSPDGLWINSHQLLPQSTVFVLKRQGEVRGTVTLVEDSPLGLPIDETFGGETQSLRRADRHLGEIASLAVSPAERSSGLVLLLVVSMWCYAEKRTAVTDLVVAVSEEIGDYYQALFNFSPYTRVKSYCGFGDTCHALDEDPVLGLRQNLATMRSYYQDWPCPVQGSFNMKTVADDSARSSYESWPPAQLAGEQLQRYKLPREVQRQVLLAAHAFGPVMVPGGQGWLLQPYGAIETGEHKVATVRAAAATPRSGRVVAEQKSRAAAQ